MKFLPLVAIASTIAVTGCATPAQQVEMQRPALPNTQGMAWKNDDRLYRSVVVDYVKGMSRRSYLFSEGNQIGYKELLDRALYRADLLAPTPTAARYALQVDFTQLDGAALGTDLTAQSVATYRLVSRATGEVIFEKPIDADFTAIFKGLNEDDAEAATGLPAAVVTGIVKAGDRLPELVRGIVAADIAIDSWAPSKDISNISRRDGRRLYQGAIWALLWDPAYVGLSFVNPFNFIGVGNYYGEMPPEAQARQGYLAESGFGARSGFVRSHQADYQMMAQSITKFVIAAADAEGVKFTTLLPCLDNSEVTAIKHDLTMQGMPWRTDECTAYSRPDAPSGVGYTTYK